MAYPEIESLVENFDAQSEALQTLQHHRVRSILLVASLYDSYTLSEGKHLSELIYGAYLHLSLSTPPQIMRVSTRATALRLLEVQRFDLVITMAQVSDMTPTAFGLAAKEIQPDLPVFLMAYNARELGGQDRGPITPEGIDRVFIWRGDVRLLLSLIKLVEDRQNVAHDSHIGGVRTLILVEDSVPFYSSYLPMLFTEIVKQTEALIAEGVNIGQRLLRRRLRPKILLATSFEEAEALYEDLHETVLAVISDVSFPRRGIEEPEAGLDLLRQFHHRDADLPLMLQSSDLGFAVKADRLHAAFLHKRSPTLLHDIQRFMLESLGFGDFVFRRPPPEGGEVARAADVSGMIGALQRVPEAVLEHHASHNHFSNWLMARTEFQLATAMRRLRITDFESMEDMRQFLLVNLTATREAGRRGQVEDFDVGRFDAGSAFVRIGGGSLGGKGRGLAFIHGLLPSAGLDTYVDDVHIFVPNSAVIGTDVFDRFIWDNQLLELALVEEDDATILGRFLDAALPEDVRADLATFVERVRYPLAVRSSSLLEDSHHLPAAGIYPTHMVPNIDADPAVRLRELERAIKHIYASTFFAGAKAYLEATPNRVEDEKMAVVLQQVVGRFHGDLVYPDFSGTARSYNFYPVREMKPEEGIATVALGLGRTVVEGERAIRFSPVHPQWLPQLSTVDDILENAQRTFWALDTGRPLDFASADPDENMVRLDLDVAEQHDTLWPVASVYVADNHAVYDGLARPGVRLVTLAPILKHKLFPLPEILELLLNLGEQGLSGPVEIEFAADLRPEGGGPRQFAFLQIRPLVALDATAGVDLDGIPDAEVFIRSRHALGAGRSREIRDIVAVRMDVFDRAKTALVAAEIGAINAQLRRDGRPYLLIGPGRWGTADGWLGIPVTWYQISGARAIVECDLDGMAVEPSQGTHFFHNMTSLGIGYFTAHKREEAWIDWDWLAALTPTWQGEWASHIALAEPLEVLIDGRKGEGVIRKPATAAAGDPAQEHPGPAQ
jgi:hypothetical protein